jgi:putative membrane protein
MGTRKASQIPLPYRTDELTPFGPHRSKKSADRRTVLAADRTIFAAERTYAAWVRTGLASLAAGVGAKAALGGIIPATIVITSGCALVLFSIFSFAAAVWRELIPGVHPLHPMFIGCRRRFS